MTKQKSQKDDDQRSKTDVIKLLTADHKKVKKLFKKFDDIKDKKNSDEKKSGDRETDMRRVDDSCAS